AAGVAFDARGLLWVGDRLAAVPGAPLPAPQGGRQAAASRARRRRSGLGGAAARAPRAALVDPFAKRVHGLRTGPGPGRPGWSPDGIRAYLADAGAGDLSVVSPLRRSRLGAIGLPPGWLPGGVVVQP